jgi:tetratricopeptide (TPR) repeat protein
LDQFDDIRVELDSILATHELPSLTKDLSYLLRADVYHPLSQLDISPAFRSSFYHPPPEEPLSSSLSTLNLLLAQGHFLLAAHLCGTLLSSPAISPTDTKTIFALFYNRLACLELTGNTVFAAQESKALEDLSSAFYYVDVDLETGEGQTPAKGGHPYHIVPWPLRVLAVRLQSIGFGDARRSVAGLYELGLDARRELMRSDIDNTKKQIWKARLADMGIRSVNALIEMGDLDAARRSLDSLKGNSADNDSVRARKALLYLRIGDVGAAKEILQESSHLEEGVLQPLIHMADGRYDDAITEWRALLERNSNKSSEPMIVQNLAVCLLYTGQLVEVFSKSDIEVCRRFLLPSNADLSRSRSLAPFLSP